MKAKRAKVYRKLMILYQKLFSFREPYQVLLDASFVKELLKASIDIPKMLEKTLQGKNKLMITQCCMAELYAAGPKHQDSVDFCRASTERRRCNHLTAIPANECMATMAGTSNKHRYVFATSEQPLRSKLRAIPGTPIIHLNRSVLILEPPSDATLRFQKSKEQEADLATLKNNQKIDASMIAKFNEEETQKLAALKSNSSSEPPPKKQRKGPSEPNPLSVKKKKKELFVKKTEGTKASDKSTKYTRPTAADKIKTSVISLKTDKLSDVKGTVDEKTIKPLVTQNESKDVAKKGRKRKRKRATGAADEAANASDDNQD